MASTDDLGIDAAAERLARFGLDIDAGGSSISSTPARYVPPHRRPHANNGAVLPSLQPQILLDQPRQRLTEAELPSPSVRYLAVANDAEPATSVTDDEVGTLPPLIVVLGVNKTLARRVSLDYRNCGRPLTRPYLSTFLSYLFSTASAAPSTGTDYDGPLVPRRRIVPVVFSAMRAINMLAFLKALSLAPQDRDIGKHEPYRADPAQGDLFSLVLCREDMNLGDQYYDNIDTVKDLKVVWENLGIEEEDGAKRTVIVYDHNVDAASQPHSRLTLPTFTPTDTSDDCELLATIAQLDTLAHQSNVPAFIRQGGLEELIVDDPLATPPNAELVERGREICRRLGIQVRADFDFNWRRHLPADSAYVDIANEKSTTVPANKASEFPPLIVVFSLDRTLVYRQAAAAEASCDPFKRPYLSCFLSYLFATRGRVLKDPRLTRRAVQTVVFTGTRAHNVLQILKSINLASPGRQSPFGASYHVDSAQGDLVDLALCREDLGLGEDYYRNVDTVKDLRKVWENLGVEDADGAKRTILLNNNLSDAAAQPHSLLRIASFSSQDKQSQTADDALLACIAQIEALRRETNVASFIRSGGLETLGSSTSTASGQRPVTSRMRHANLVQQGKEICRALGIPVHATYDSKWRKHIGLEATEKANPFERADPRLYSQWREETGDEPGNAWDD
ncbi:hypothetical protein JCM3774_003668 [Rhodotorula dairenensis]